MVALDKQSIEPNELDVIYKRFVIAGLLLVILPVVLLLPDEKRAGPALLALLFVPAGGLVAFSAAWKARRVRADWRVQTLVGGAALLGVVALGVIMHALSNPQRATPHLIKLGLFLVLVVFPAVSFGLAGWWFLVARRAR